MTPRENFQRLMHGESAWTPLDLPVTPPILDRIEQHCGTRDVVEAFDLDFRDVAVAWSRGARPPEAWRDAYARQGVNLPDDAEINAFGITHRKPPAESIGEAYHFREMLHPLETFTSVAQLESLPWPDMQRISEDSTLAQRIAAARQEGRATVVSLECTLFEHAWYLRGMDMLFMDIIEDGEVGPWLLDWFTQRSIAATVAAARAGVDIIRLGDDIGTQRGMMMAPDFWREHFKPRLARVFAAIRQVRTEQPVYVFYHSDGDVREVIDDLIEIGVDILNPLQPECMPHDEVIPRYRDRLAFWGLIGTQTTMPFGTPADVVHAVQQCLEHRRTGARIAIAPTHVLEPDVPWDNIVALVDAVQASRSEILPAR